MRPILTNPTYTELFVAQLLTIPSFITKMPTITTQILLSTNAAQKCLDTLNQKLKTDRVQQIQFLTLSGADTSQNALFILGNSLALQRASKGTPHTLSLLLKIIQWSMILSLYYLCWGCAHKAKVMTLFLPLNYPVSTLLKQCFRFSANLDPPDFLLINQNLPSTPMRTKSKKASDTTLQVPFSPISASPQALQLRVKETSTLWCHWRICLSRMFHPQNIMMLLM